MEKLEVEWEYPLKLTGRSSAAQTPNGPGAAMCVLSHFALGPSMDLWMPTGRCTSWVLDFTKIKSLVYINLYSSTD